MSMGNLQRGSRPGEAAVAEAPAHPKRYTLIPKH